MEHITDHGKFEREVRAAPAVLRHLRTAPPLRRMQLLFEYAAVDPASHRAVVKFTCRPPHRHTVWVHATLRPDDTWAVTHSFTW